jgi:transposase
VKFEVTKNQSHLKTRTMSKGKELNFEGQIICCGLDVHKTNWKVSSRMDNIELASFSQNPDPKLLSNYFKKNYPGATVKVVYEAGFCGFGIQRSLTELGIECIVVNAADVPSSDKERKRKTDKVDARKLSRELAEGNLKGIYIPEIAIEHVRVLVRERYRLVQDQTRCKNRIKHMLMCNGIAFKSKNWSGKSVKELEKIQCSVALKTALNLAIEEFKQIRTLIKEATLAIRNMAKETPFVQIQKYLQSIDGISLINGMVIQTEIQDIKRFRTLDNLCGYAGLVPDINSSDERMVITGITSRCNEFLRKALIESSWILIRKDPAMLLKYNEYRKRMNKNKAIIRIARHLLARIRYVWNNQNEYERGIVG